jgi:hypothetical protein
VLGARTEKVLRSRGCAQVPGCHGSSRTYRRALCHRERKSEDVRQTSGASFATRSHRRMYLMTLTVAEREEFLRREQAE